MTTLVSILLVPKIHYQKDKPFIITLDLFFEHYILRPEGASKWEMFVTLQHVMATPVTTPNSRHLINNNMSFEGCLVEGGTCIFGVLT